MKLLDIMWYFFCEMFSKIPFVIYLFHIPFNPNLIIYFYTGFWEKVFWLLCRCQIFGSRCHHPWYDLSDVDSGMGYYYHCCFCCLCIRSWDLCLLLMISSLILLWLISSTAIYITCIQCVLTNPFVNCLDTIFFHLQSNINWFVCFYV